MGYGKSGLCGDSGISLRPLPVVANSFNMSSQLLQVCTAIACNLHDTLRSFRNPLHKHCLCAAEALCRRM